MQPAPLTGTATPQCRDTEHLPWDAARAPHGDSNSVEQMPVTRRVDAARSPHGDSNTSCLLFDHVPRDAARAPHGDSNIGLFRYFPQFNRDAARAPHGDSNPFRDPCVQLLLDAARTPHGDSNCSPLLTSS